MEALSLIGELLSMGCVIRVQDGRPIVTGPAAAEPLVRRLRPYRQDVLNLFDPEAWSRRGWIIRLRRLAEACESLHPTTATAYRMIAAAVETAKSAMGTAQ